MKECVTSVLLLFVKIGVVTILVAAKIRNIAVIAMDV
jgi:hypothetical protein